MKTSDAGIELIKDLEGFSARPYLCSAGKLTIGYGHVILKDERLTSVSDEAATELLRRDVMTAESCVDAAVEVPITQSMFDALVSFVFNVGCPAFRHSTLLRMLNDRQYRKAAKQFLLWNKATVCGVKTEIRGLTIRREREMKLFLSEGVYD